MNATEMKNNSNTKFYVNFGNGSQNGSPELEYYFDLYGDYEDESFYLVMDILNVYLTPIIIFVGLGGNLLSFLVFIFTHIKRLSSSMYLAALALADSGFLLSLLIGWCSWTSIELFHRDGWCQLVIYMTFVCSFLSVWYVVCFTVERYIAVCHPFKRQDMCTTGRAKAVVLGLAGFALLLYSYGTWTSGVMMLGDMATCTPLPRYKRAIAILNNIDTVTTLIVPFIVITVLNIRIFTAIVSVYRQRENTMDKKNKRTSDKSEYISPRPKSRHGMRLQLRVTKMLLVVSTVFLVLNVPSHAVRMYAFITELRGSELDLEMSLKIRKWQQPCQFLYYIQFSVNIFLYSLCGKNFRQALRRMCSKVRYRAARVLWGSQTPTPNMMDVRRVDDDQGDFPAAQGANEMARFSAMPLADDSESSTPN